MPESHSSNPNNSDEWKQIVANLGLADTFGLFGTRTPDVPDAAASYANSNTIRPYDYESHRSSPSFREWLPGDIIQGQFAICQTRSPQGHLLGRVHLQAAHMLPHIPEGDNDLFTAQLSPEAYGMLSSVGYQNLHVTMRVNEGEDSAYTVELLTIQPEGAYEGNLTELPPGREVMVQGIVKSSFGAIEAERATNYGHTIGELLEDEVIVPGVALSLANGRSVWIELAKKNTDNLEVRGDIGMDRWVLWKLLPGDMVQMRVTRRGGGAGLASTWSPNLIIPGEERRTAYAEERAEVQDILNQLRTAPNPTIFRSALSRIARELVRTDVDAGQVYQLCLTYEEQNELQGLLDSLIPLMPFDEQPILSLHEFNASEIFPLEQLQSLGFTNLDIFAMNNKEFIQLTMHPELFANEPFKRIVSMLLDNYPPEYKESFYRRSIAALQAQYDPTTATEYCILTTDDALEAIEVLSAGDRVRRATLQLELLEAITRPVAILSSAVRNERLHLIGALHTRIMEEFTTSNFSAYAAALPILHERCQALVSDLRALEGVTSAQYSPTEVWKEQMLLKVVGVFEEITTQIRLLAAVRRNTGQLPE